jgi:hypothetical protein
MSLVVLETFGVRSFASIQGAISMVLATVPVFAGPILAGRLFDTTGSYETSFWIVSGIFALGGMLVLSVRVQRGPVPVPGDDVLIADARESGPLQDRRSGSAD